MKYSTNHSEIPRSIASEWLMRAISAMRTLDDLMEPMVRLHKEVTSLLARTGDTPDRPGRMASRVRKDLGAIENDIEYLGTFPGKHLPASRALSWLNAAIRSEREIIDVEVLIEELEKSLRLLKETVYRANIKRPT